MARHLCANCGEDLGLWERLQLERKQRRIEYWFCPECYRLIFSEHGCTWDTPWVVFMKDLEYNRRAQLKWRESNGVPEEVPFAALPDWEWEIGRKLEPHGYGRRPKPISPPSRGPRFWVGAPAYCLECPFARDDNGTFRCDHPSPGENLLGNLDYLLKHDEPLWCPIPDNRKYTFPHPSPPESHIPKKYNCLEHLGERYGTHPKKCAKCGAAEVCAEEHSHQIWNTHKKAHR